MTSSEPPHPPTTPSRNWLFGPIVAFAVSQSATALGSVFLAVRFPSDAALIFGPQAIGSGVIAVGAVAFAARLRPGGGPQLIHLGGPVKIGAIGFLFLTLGWSFYAWSARDTRWEVTAAASVGALSVAIQGAATLWVAKRMRTSTRDEE